MKKWIRKWLGVDEIAARMEDAYPTRLPDEVADELRRFAVEAWKAVVTGEGSRIDDRQWPWSRLYGSNMAIMMHKEFCQIVAAQVKLLGEKEARLSVDQAVGEKLEYLERESFIDDIVERIKRKQING